MQKDLFGKKGEKLAVDYLTKIGYKIIATNYRNKIGEIDIIAEDGNYIVFVEVKSRMSRAFGDPLEAIGAQKQHKIMQVAQGYLMKTRQLNAPCRFDAVAVLGDKESEIRHVKNAFGM